MQLTHEGQLFECTRHIQMPFHLFKDGTQHEPCVDQMRAIMALFPTCTELSFSPPYITVICSSLPPKQWPTTVAGIPLFLTSDLDEYPMDIGLTAINSPKATIQTHIERWITPDLTCFKLLFAMSNELKAGIHKLQWNGWGFIALGVALPTEDWRSRLPWMVNTIRIGYVWGRTL